jgi:glycosyltransferase involved in cell wall biosynthesis
MKILTFTGEKFSKNIDGYVSKQTSVAFVQKVFGEAQVEVVGAIDKDSNTENYSSCVNSSSFYEITGYDSTKDFLWKSLFKKGFLKQYIEHINKLLAEKKIDYVWIRTPSIGSIMFGLCALKNEFKVINHICANAGKTWRDPKYSSLEKAFGFCASILIKHLLSRICRHKNTINFTTGSELQSFSKKYSKSNTYQMVDMMISEQYIDKSRTFSVNNEVRKILFIGRIVRDKGVFDLVDTVDNDARFSLTIIGGGADFKELKDYIADKKSSNIQLTGQLPHSELHKFLNETDLVCVPSNNFYEGFPRVIMEAWAYEKPVVVSNVGGISAFVKNAENGLVISPGNQIELRKALVKTLDENIYKLLKEGAVDMKKYSTVDYWTKFIRRTLNVS